MPTDRDAPTSVHFDPERTTCVESTGRHANELGYPLITNAVMEVDDFLAAIGKLPWNEPPTADAVRSKFGAQTGEVTALYRSHGPSGVEPEAT